MKKIIILSALIIVVFAKVAWAEKITLSLDCLKSKVFISLHVPEGKKAHKFRVNEFSGGRLCDPDAPPHERYFVYGWGVQKKGRYYYAKRFHKSSVTEPNKLGSVWLPPGNYTVELEGQKDARLDLEYTLSPYSAEDTASTPSTSSSTSSIPSSTTSAPSATETAKAKSKGHWSGTWYAHPGEIIINQKGNTFTGHYTLEKGKISGTVKGKMLVGKWSDGPTYKPPMDAGEIRYKMSPDGQSFMVDWRPGYEEHGQPWVNNAWKATRKP